MLRLALLCAVLSGCSCPRPDLARGLVPVASNLPTSGQWRTGFSLVDLDADGRLDLLHGAPRKGERAPQLWLNDGAAHFTRTRPPLPPLRWDYGDAVSPRPGTLFFGVHLGALLAVRREGETWLDDSAGLPDDFSSRALALTDWDGDGQPDVLALSDGPRPGTPSAVALGLRVASRGPGGWTLRRVRELDGRFGDAVVAADFDGDGRSDVATSSNVMGETRLVDFGGEPQPPRTLPLPPRGLVRSVAAGDLDADGRAELLLVISVPREDTFESSLVRLDFEGDGWRLSPALATQPLALSAVTTFDPDGDGDLDVAAADERGGVRVWLNDGRGNFTPTAPVPPPGWRLGCQVGHLAGGDLDGRKGEELVLSAATEDAPGSDCPSSGGLEVFTWR